MPGTEKCLVLYFWHPMLVRPVMKRLFYLEAKNGLGRFAPSALPHYTYPHTGDQARSFEIDSAAPWQRAPPLDNVQVAAVLAAWHES